MLLIAVQNIDGNYCFNTSKYIIVDDDYNYGSQCDDTTNLIVVSELRNKPIEDLRQIK